MRLGAAVLIIAATRAALGGTLFFIASGIVDRVAAASTALQPLIVATGVAAAIGGAVDVVVTFLGFARLSALLSRFYIEEAGTSQARVEPAGDCSTPLGDGRTGRRPDRPARLS